MGRYSNNRYKYRRKHCKTFSIFLTRKRNHLANTKEKIKTYSDLPLSYNILILVFALRKLKMRKMPVEILKLIILHTGLIRMPMQNT